MPARFPSRVSTRVAAGVLAALLLAGCLGGDPVASVDVEETVRTTDSPAKAIWKTERVDGRLEAGSGVLGQTQTPASVPVRVDATRGNVSAVVIEVTWGSSQTGTTELRLAYGDARDQGASPLRVDAPWAGGNVSARLSIPDGVRVNVEQPFTAFVSVFYDSAVPADFSALRGA